MVISIMPLRSSGKQATREIPPLRRRPTSSHPCCRGSIGRIETISRRSLARAPRPCTIAASKTPGEDRTQDHDCQHLNVPFFRRVPPIAFHLVVVTTSRSAPLKLLSGDDEVRARVDRSLVVARRPGARKDQNVSLLKLNPAGC